MTCLGCGDPLVPPQGVRGGRICSSRCANRIKRASAAANPSPGYRCALCGAQFSPIRTDQRYCRPRCARLARDIGRGQVLIGPIGYVITCAICGKRGAVASPCRKTCHDCPPLSEINHKGLSTIPRLRLAVFAADEYRCQLCGGMTRPDLGPQSMLAPTIDHIVPVSDAGPDVFENFQTAHRYCNTLKKALSVEEFERRYLLDYGISPYRGVN